MPNKLHGNLSGSGGGPEPSTDQKSGAGSTPGMANKPGFPNASVPSTQPRARNAGVRKAKIHPNSKGL